MLKLAWDANVASKADKEPRSHKTAFFRRVFGGSNLKELPLDAAGSSR